MSRMQSASVELSELPPEIPLIQPGILSDFVGDGGGCMLGEGPSSRRGEARTVAWRILLAPRKFPHRRVFCWRSFGYKYGTGIARSTGKKTPVLKEFYAGAYITGITYS